MATAGGPDASGRGIARLGSGRGPGTGAPARPRRAGQRRRRSSRSSVRETAATRARPAPLSAGSRRGRSDGRLRCAPGWQARSGRFPSRSPLPRSARGAVPWGVGGRQPGLEQGREAHPDLGGRSVPKWRCPIRGRGGLPRAVARSSLSQATEPSLPGHPIPHMKNRFDSVSSGNVDGSMQNCAERALYALQSLNTSGIVALPAQPRDGGMGG